MSACVLPVRAFSKPVTLGVRPEIIQNTALPRIFLVILIALLSFMPSVLNATDLKFEIFFSDSTAFMEEWTKTPYEHSPTIRRISSARIGQLVYGGFAVSGFKLDPDGYAFLELDLRIIDPTGKLLFKKEPFSTTQYKLKSENGIILLSSVLDFLIEDGDPTGQYTISCRLFDNIGKSAVVSDYKLMIEEKDSE